ncbi:MAG: mechanosensitive ion channel family protein [Candidatus Eremiobacteraeota bacterium]|nr:mechanosensitive ion channel family protein [Candidatus Eremiobacteraeota bacterium]
MGPDEVFLEIERHNLEVAAVALLMLLALFGVHHFFFKHLQPRHPMLRLLQERLRYLTTIFVFLVPLRWAAGQIQEMVTILDELHVGVIFVLVLLGLESLYSLLFIEPDGTPRLSPTVHFGLASALYGIPGVVFLALISGFPLFDRAMLYALGSIFTVYLCMHLLYAFVFKWVNWTHPLALALKARLRFWAYVTVLGLVCYFAVTRYTFIPVTGNMVDNLALCLWILLVCMVAESILAGVFDFYFPVAKKSEIPTLFRDLTRALVYIGLATFFVGFVLKRDLNSLLVGSAVITVSIGFALQETLGNFFAGLALRLSQPYTLGDYVEVANFIGRVEKIDWRQTAILTNNGDYVLMPNSMLAKEAISNHSSPTRLHARYIEVGTHYRHPPNMIKKAMLEAAASVPDVLPDPRPELYIMDFSDSAILYRLRYWLADFGERFRVDTQVRAAVWYRFKRDGIEIPFPIRTLVKEPQVSQDELLDEVRGFLQTVDFLNALDEEALNTLSHRARFQLFAGGEKICVQGQTGDSFYIIKSGKVQVAAADEDTGEVFLCAEIAPGNYFGEMALLTGEPRSATVTALVDSELLTLSKDDLRSIIVGNSEVEKIISNVLAQRQLRTAKAKEEAEEERMARANASGRGQGARLDQLSEQFLRKIQEFFSY